MRTTNLMGFLNRDEERARLNELDSFRILDTAPESVYDDAVAIAAEICQVPVALISFVDEYRQWFKAKIGTDLTSTPRELSLCSHVVLNKNILIVPDATLDSRFQNNPLVVHDPHIRFYAGIPLMSANGHVLGTICLLDVKPRNLTETQIKALVALQRQVMREMEKRRVQEEVNGRVIMDFLLREKIRA